VLAASPLEFSTQGVVCERLREAALKAGRVYAVYLFGSRARGDAEPESDYDLLVVTWETSRAEEMRRVLVEAGAELDAVVDVKVVNPAMFLWRSRFANTVERAASREGVVLYMVEREEELRDAAAEWFQRGDRDLIMAETCLNNEALAGLVCFHAQQCVEKYLKGYLTFREEHVGRTHSLAALLEVCVRLDERLGRWREPLAPFERYAVETRYPGGYEPSLEEARRAVAVAGELRDFVLGLVEG